MTLAHRVTNVEHMSKNKTFKPTSLNDTKLQALRERVLSMLDSGKTSAQVATRLALSPATVAAYAAHRTMGTY